MDADLGAALVDAAEGSEAAGCAVAPWCREADLAVGEEDAAKNEAQAERNAVIRKLLFKRRQEHSEQNSAAPPEEFMVVGALYAKAASSAAVASDSQPPWFVPRPHIPNVVLRLHEELLDFGAFMKHTSVEVKARREWVQAIGKACRELWPTCQVRIFGSFFTGLSLPNADVDVAVSDVPCKAGTAMKMLADRMLSTGEISWLEIIESAKVPVVKIRSQACGLRADVVFNQPDGIDTSKFVHQKVKEFPQMRPLLIFLKYFLLQRGLHETYTGGMGSYLLCNVVLHFIQRHPSLKNPRLYSATSLGHLLFDFFKYYGQEFQYDHHGISVQNGGQLFKKAERGWGYRRGGKGGGIQLCLESPIGPAADLGSPCFRMNILRNLFHHGYHCLCHLFTSGSDAEVSLLCPLLLDSAHPVITDRNGLMSEQPVALLGLPRARSTSEEDVQALEQQALEADGVCSGGKLPGMPAPKRQRLGTGPSKENVDLGLVCDVAE